jgi:hypothetical protein
MPATADVRERSARRRVGLAWGLLVLNTLVYTGSLLHVPSVVGKGITQAALPAALLVALTVNRRVVVRPNVFLCLLVLLAAEAIVTSLQPQYFSAVYRTFRFAEFVAALWLLTPWWGRRDLLLIRCHLISLAVVLASVILGLLVAPGHALATGRLSGVLWEVPPTQVAHYAAVVLGATVVLWLCGRLRGRPTLLIVSVTAAILLATHTRTALAALIAGLLVAGLSLIVASQRVRKVFAAAAVVATVAIVTLSGFLTAWLERGQGTSQLTKLTGRTQVWGPLLNFPRDRFQEIFGFGLSNDSFNGLPIDSNWFASYQAQGLFGVALCGAILLFLMLAAAFRPRGVGRALALFFIIYCLVASFTEVGFTNATPYLLDLALAVSLLVPPATREPRSASRSAPQVLRRRAH